MGKWIALSIALWATDAGATTYLIVIDGGDVLPARTTRAMPIPAMIKSIAEQEGCPADLLHAVVWSESAFKETAISRRGAYGLGQLMPETAIRFGVNRYDRDDNLRGSARYLKWLITYYDGDLTKVVAAYNAGEGKVDRYGGVPPYEETRNYVRKVFARLH